MDPASKALQRLHISCCNSRYLMQLNLFAQKASNYCKSTCAIRNKAMAESAKLTWKNEGKMKKAKKRRNLGLTVHETNIWRSFKWTYVVGFGRAHHVSYKLYKSLSNLHSWISLESQGCSNLGTMYLIFLLLNSCHLNGGYWSMN